MAENAEFFLQLKRFKDNTNFYWQNLRNEDYFSDVTLACVDKQIKAHKVVLSASSPVLEDILIHNPHPNPIIYLKGIQSSEMVSLLDFIYLGETAIMKEQLNDFLAVANELKIKGLSDKNKKVFHKKGFQDIEMTSPRKRKDDIYALSQYTEENFHHKIMEENSGDFSHETRNMTVQSNNSLLEDQSKFTESNKLELVPNDSNSEVNNARESKSKHIVSETIKMNEENNIIISKGNNVISKDDLKVSITDGNKKVFNETISQDIERTFQYTWGGNLQKNIEDSADKKVCSKISSQDIERTSPRKRKVDIIYALSHIEEKFLKKNIEEDSMNFSDETKNIIVQSNSNMFGGPSKFTDCDKLELLPNDSNVAVNNTHKSKIIADNSRDVRHIDSETTDLMDENNRIISETNSVTNKDEFEKLKFIQNHINIDIDNVHSNTKEQQNIADTAINIPPLQQSRKEINDVSDHNAEKDTTLLLNQNKICKLCNFKTDGKGDLDLHRQSSHQDRFFCELCDCNTTNKAYLKTHVLTVHEGILNICDKCDYKTAVKPNFKRHMRTKHGEGGIWYFCQDCDYSAADKTTLKRHKLSIHDGVRYPCGHCNYKAPQKCMLKRHEKSQHK